MRDVIEKIRQDFYDYINERTDETGRSIYFRWRKLRGEIALLFVEKGRTGELLQIQKAK